VILCCIQVVLGGAFYILISNWLLGQSDSTLSATAAQVSATLQGADLIDDGLLKFQFNDPDEPTDAFLQERKFFIRLINRRTGQIVESSASYEVAVSSQALLPSASYETLRSAGTSMRVYSYPFDEGDYSLQVGVSLEEVNATQAQIMRLTALAVLISIVLGGGTGLFLANRALVPIQAITRTAQQISERDLSKRITRPLVDDELGQLAQTFNTMLDRVEGAFQRQQHFTADAAHELRTPLSIMQTGIDVVLSQARDAAQYRAALEAVQEEVQRLTSLTVGLLTLARADSHTLTLNREVTDLSLLINTVIDQVTAVAEQKQITIQREIVPCLALNMDEGRIIQLALNLIENAVKYTPEGGAVTVIVSQTGDTVSLSVADTGPGIPPEYLPRIFDRFYRTDRSRSRDQGGVGLGLAIAQHIAQLHGGEINVWSQVGVGTRFTVTLPVS